jgi:hypothetical protein
MPKQFEDMGDGRFRAEMDVSKGKVQSKIVVEVDTDEETLAIAVGPLGKLGYDAMKELVFYGPVAYELGPILLLLLIFLTAAAVVVVLIVKREDIMTRINLDDIGGRGGDRGDRGGDRDDPYTGSRKGLDARSTGSDPEPLTVYLEKGKVVGIKYLGHVLPFQVVADTDRGTIEGLRTCYRRGLQAIIQSMRLVVPTRSF